MDDHGRERLTCRHDTDVKIELIEGIVVEGLVVREYASARRRRGWRSESARPITSDAIREPLPTKRSHARLPPGESLFT